MFKLSKFFNIDVNEDTKNLKEGCLTGVAAVLWIQIPVERKDRIEKRIECGSVPYDTAQVRVHIQG